MQRMLGAELTEHLGYEHVEAPPPVQPNRYERGSPWIVRLGMLWGRFLTVGGDRVGIIRFDRRWAFRSPRSSRGANDLRAIFRWGRRPRPEALRQFGIESGRAPCHATCHYFFRALDADALAATLGSYVQGEAAGGHIAIDGTSLRGGAREDAKALYPQK